MIEFWSQLSRVCVCKHGDRQDADGRIPSERLHDAPVPNRVLRRPRSGPVPIDFHPAPLLDESLASLPRSSSAGVSEHQTTKNDLLSHTSTSAQAMHKSNSCAVSSPPEEFVESILVVVPEPLDLFEGQPGAEECRRRTSPQRLLPLRGTLTWSSSLIALSDTTSAISVSTWDVADEIDPGVEVDTQVRLDLQSLVRGTVGSLQKVGGEEGQRWTAQMGSEKGRRVLHGDRK